MSSYPYSGVGTVERYLNQLQAMIVLKVTGASRGELLSSRYRVEINGVTRWISGSWEVSFSLSGN